MKELIDHNGSCTVRSDITQYNVYFCQLTHGSQEISQNYHMPLAIGCLAAYLIKNLDEKINVELFKYPEELSSRLGECKPNIVFFSVYMWNKKLSMYYAEIIKKVYGNALVVFGGPDISFIDEENINFLRRNEFIDVLVRGDGEKVVCEIVNEFIGSRSVESVKKLKIGNLFSVLSDGTAVIFDGDSVKLGEKGNESLSEIPSPYVLGLMDKFFMDGTIPLIETNRGCPFKCSYCQQGGVYYSRVRRYDLDRLKNEIEYIASKIYKLGLDIHILEIADPNFAMYKRDSDFISYVREMQDKYSFPKEIWCSTGKNKTEIIVDNINKLKEGSIVMRAAVQSLNVKTLKSINRDNISLDVYFKVMNDNQDKGLSTGADVMLGLPMENKTTHIEGFYVLIDKRITEFAALQTIKLNGTEMEKTDFIDQYGIKTKYRVIPECCGDYEVLSTKKYIMELERVVVETSRLSFNDYLQCRKFHFLLMIYHNTRLIEHIYYVLDFMDIPRSEVIKNIYSLTVSENKSASTEQWSKVLDDFIIDTKNELMDSDNIDILLDNVGGLTSNKIFKHLAKALYKNNQSIILLLRISLSRILQNNEIVNELMHMFSIKLIDIFNFDLQEERYQVKNAVLKNILGDYCVAYVTDEQARNIRYNVNKYKNKDDVIDNVMYHLRPKNSSKTMRFMR